MADQKLFKELEIGFRELFRIVIPGAYFLSLAQVIAPDSSFTKIMTSSTASGLAATFFLGLIGYALRPHERWFPYFLYFETQRSKLNNEISRITGLSNAVDNVHIYKYFLETGATEFSDRIHYFSSFYYMLVELSLFSAAGAYFVAARSLFQSLSATNQGVAHIGIALIAVACIIQLAVLFALTSVRTRPTQILLYVAFGISIAAILWMITVGAFKNMVAVCGALQNMGWTPILLLLAYLFWRLGEKHWLQIIDEQTVLVNAKAIELIRAAKTYSQKES